MSGQALDRVLAALEAHGTRYQRRPDNGFSARCPCHQGRGETSLSVRQIEGRALVHCFGGCETAEVLASIGLGMVDLFDSPEGQRYVYQRRDGSPGRIVVRSPDKRFRQSGDTKRCDLYRLPAVVDGAAAGRTIYLVEGEQDVHTLESLGELATTAPMGGRNVGKVDVTPLKGATVIAVADNDATGQAWAKVVNERLAGFAGSLEFRRAKDGKDVTDHIMRGYGVAELVVVDAPGERPWGTPVPLGWRPGTLPDFPTTALPPVYRAYVAALAESTQTPADLPGTVVLGAIAVAVAVAGKVIVRPRGRWVEPVNLWVVPVAPPASRKSAVIAAATQPLRDAEAFLYAEQAGQIREATVRYQVLSSRADKAQDVAVKQGDETSIQAAVNAAKEAERAAPMAHPKLIVQDATPEALIGCMAEQGGRIAGISAEAGIFDSLTGRYKKEKFLDHLLSSHAGEQILVDRQTRGSQRIDRPALTLIACMQPYAVTTMVSSDSYGGRGLLARVLWSVARDNVGFRKVEPDEIPDSVAERYTFALRNLTLGMANRPEVTELSLDHEAQRVLVDFHQRIEVQLRPTERMGSSLLRGWGGKAHGVAVRIAGCLHTAEHGLTRPLIDAHTMRCAVRLTEYFTAHAITVLGKDDEGIGDCRTVLQTLIDKVIDDRDPDHGFKIRELQRALPRRLRGDNERITWIVDSLENAGWLRAGKGGYQLHPHAAEALQHGDNGDSDPDNTISPGHETISLSPLPVTPGDSDQDRSTETPSVSPPVTRDGDTKQSGLSRGNAHPGSPVTAVTTVPNSPRIPAPCGSAETPSLFDEDPDWAPLFTAPPAQNSPDVENVMEWSA